MNAPGAIAPQAAPRPRAAVAITLFLLFALAPVLAAGSGANAYTLNLFTRVMVFALAAMSLDLICGYGGLVSFGHAAFIGVGAYSVGILASLGVHDILIAIPVALVASALFGYLTGAVCLRAKNVSFIMITLAFGQMAYFVAGSLAAYGGDDGMTLDSRNTLFGRPFLRDDRVLYYVALAILLGAHQLCRAIVRSRFGRVLRGARENPERMSAIGFDIQRHQHVAYVVAGALCGLSGVLLANTTEFVSPAYMSWQRSGELIIMVLFGGVGTLEGAILGAMAFVLAEELLGGLTENWKLIFGPLLVAVVMVGRGGLLGSLNAFTRGLSRA